MRQGLTLGSIVSVATLALLIFPSGAGASAVPAPTPAHWWQAEGNANDSVGTDNGRLVGVGFGPGVSGTDQAFSFTGGAHQVIFNKTGGNRRRGDFTLVFDVKTTATGALTALWEKRIACDSSGTPFWGFRMQAGGQATFELFSARDYDNGITSTTAINDGAWHQVAATRHGPTVSLYVDGQLEATGTSPTTINVTNQAPMRAGVSRCDGIDGTHPFTGELDELMIFRSVLTQPQIQALRS
jgi:Concanavalin A-like lectin/glucanases superfamily